MKVEGGIERKLTRARTQLLLNQPFFGTLCLRLKLVQSDLPTMATDGKRIVYSSTFVAQLKPAELEAVLAHEVLHCALGHHCRRGERDPQLWNQAADLAINPVLVANGFTLPADALLDPAFVDLSAEEIYAHLVQRKCQSSNSGLKPRPQPDDGDGASTSGPAAPGHQPSDLAPSPGDETQQDGSTSKQRSPGPGGFGEVLDAADEEGYPASQAEKSRQRHEWSIAADQALCSAKMCGREPASVKRPLDESRQSKQDWQSILRDFITARTPSDYCWSPPNRRHIAAGLYLPSVARTGLGPIVIAVDTSGSIGRKELEQFAGEISAIAEEAQPEAIHVVYCDAAVQSSQEFLPPEPIHLEPKGGGGTDFCPVFDWVRVNNVEPDCLIYLTDLCCDSYPQAPEFPVLWVTSSRRTAPFGETLEMCVE